VRDPVQALLEAGRANIAARRLTTPPVTNALDRFKLALVIEPDNVEAAQGIANVAQAYLELAAAQAEPSAFEAWLELVSQAEAVAAAHPAAAPQAAAARSAREARAQQLMAVGEAAIRGFKRDDAVAAFEAAQRAAPGMAAATSGLAKANKVGTVGYVFSDPATGGESGAEMVVVAKKLALGRREVTRGEFSRYWGAAGSARFGANMPDCRDESKVALFSGSKSRNWQKPDVAQNDRHPVVCVSFPMAEDYARWLSTQTGKRYRLPKAAELAPYVKSLVANCKANLRDVSECRDGHDGTAPVGSFAVVPPGLYDTVGNVGEWTSDCDRGNCGERISVGGNWHSRAGESPQEARQADRAFNTVGFRLVREID
jgi:formylglycine-generating enzyme required for sulfatase activity